MGGQERQLYSVLSWQSVQEEEEAATRRQADRPWGKADGRGPVSRLLWVCNDLSFVSLVRRSGIVPVRILSASDR
jgi:hypothetical protein